MAVNTQPPLRRVLLVLPSLSAGGSERVVLTLANYLDRSRFQVHLATITGTGDWTGQVAQDVRLHQLQAKRELFGILPLRQLICHIKPDVVMSSAIRLNVALLMLRFLLPSGIRVIVREGNLLSHKIDDTRHPRLWRWLVATLYPQADRIIAQCDVMAEDLIKTAGIDVNNIVRIYNPVDVRQIDTLAEEGENPFEGHSAAHAVVAIGSFKAQKGFSRLLDSFASGPDWLAEAHLWILGDGAQRADLRAQSARLGIADRVHFPGVQENPFAWLRHADLFVLSSHYEGLPNVLLEAIVCQCPVVAWNCPGGVREIMEICRLEKRLLQEVTWDQSLLSGDGGDEARKRLEQSFGLGAILVQYESEFAREASTT